MAPTKRKRPERPSMDAGESRPSPHRPQNTNLGQHDRGQDMRDGGRRASRGGPGGAGGRGGRRNDSRDHPNKGNVNMAARATPGPMSPPPQLSSATQTPTPVVELPSPVPKPDPAPFDYTFLTDDRLASWDTTGRQEVIKSGTQARQDEDAMDLASVFQDLIRATLDGRLDPTDAGSCVKEILGEEATSADRSTVMFDPSIFFLDTLSMMVEADTPPGPPNTPANPNLRPFISATGVSPSIMRQVLDGRLLQDTGLTRDTFVRVGVRQATNLLYRQANYNLLREETEGYSKLITELFTTPHSESPSAEVAKDTFEKVKGLIGTFDLDVGRVLDITMDVFATILVKHFRFFVKLLRVSSWWPRIGDGDLVAAPRGLPAWALPSSAGWLLTEEQEEQAKEKNHARDTLFWPRAREIGLDAFFELGGSEMVDEKTRKRILGAGGDNEELDMERRWIKETGTFPAAGNRVAAQLLGFKLRFYGGDSDARDDDEILPDNLIYLTALLIKIGFISLSDIYPHLWPSDEDMPERIEMEKRNVAEKEKANRPGGGGENALTGCVMLPDDTLPRSREALTAKPEPQADAAAEKKKPIKDQKGLLVIHLLIVGAIPEALFILGRFPKLPEAYPEISNHVNRILNHSIKDVYATCQPTATEDTECPMKKIPEPDQSGVPKGQVRLTESPPRKLMRWPFPDSNDTNEAKSYRFYWDEWADNVPVCQSVDDLFTLCDTFMSISNVSIGKDAQLLSKLARIGLKSLVEDCSQHNLCRWQDLLKRTLVPALSLNKANTAVVDEVWRMLKFYPISVRYAIYADWFEGRVTPQLPAMKIAFERARLETLSTMKRISGVNAQSMARTLSKTATACPGVVFKVALTQIESYTNLTKVVVECAKYFSDLGYDVLVWSLMNALGGHKRSRNNAEFALLPSRWLLALSTFTAEVFKRYKIMDLAPIIQYVNDQLYRGNSTDLVILKELISEMAGVVPNTDFGDKELLAMSGGPVLRKQTLINLKDGRFESKKAGDRLMGALVNTNLAGELLISIAQYRQSAIYKISDEDAHIKMLATMIDDTQSTLAQYLDLLRSNFSVEEFDKHVPGIPELLAEFGLSPALAFMIGRASIASRISQAKAASQHNAMNRLQASTESAPVTVDADGDVGMENGVKLAQTNGHAEKEINSVIDSQSPSPPLAISPTDPYGKVLEPIITGVQSALPGEYFDYISADFYVTFWTATLGDLSPPLTSYVGEMKRIEEEMKAIVRDRTDMSRAGMDAKEKTRKSLSEKWTELDEERKAQGNSQVRKDIKARLLRKSSGWFKPFSADAVSADLFEKCLLPRILLSPSDADFCFQMIRFLHENGVPHFRTLGFYVYLFRSNRLRSIIFTCTIREAENLGRFLRLVLIDLQRWHSDAAVYDREAKGKLGKEDLQLPGFAKALDSDGKPLGYVEHDGEPTKCFKSCLLRWHQALNTALRSCLEGTEWMHIRNAITILKSVVDVFPAIDFQGNSFIKQLEMIAKREKGVREDLSLTGNAVLVQLKKRSKNWVMIQAFGHTSIDKSPSQTNGNAPKDISTTSKSGLKPTAPEFKPQSRASSRGASTPKPSVDVEDGEVDDAKTSIAAPHAVKPTSAPNSEARSTPPIASAMEAKKSDILSQRENFKRNNAAARAATPPRDSNVPARPDLSRTTLNDRRAPNLPSRPDVPVPSHQDLHASRHGDRRDWPDTRIPDQDPRRLDRPRDRPRDFSGNDRRTMDTGPRDFRSSDRSSGSDRDRERDRIRPNPPPMWRADAARENPERPSNSGRGGENGRVSRDMPPPISSGASSDRGPPTNPDRPPLVSIDRHEIVNPERAALISNEEATKRSNSPRRGREEPRSRISSRPQSPRRHVAEKDFLESRRDDRSMRNGASDNYASSRSRTDEVQPPPAGPRNDRSLDRTNERIPSDRSAFQSTQPLPRPVDPDHGRLNTSARPQTDPNFGRLNPAPVPAPPAAADIPSGPRDRNPRGGRLQRQDRRVDGPRPPSPDKQPPTGPSVRNPRRSASGQFDQMSTTQSLSSSTSTAALPAAGIHPDRLKHLGSAIVPPPVTPVTAAAAPPIHPDRLRAFENESPIMPPPAALQSNSRIRPALPPVATGAPPSGPKGSQPSPGGLGTNGLAAPTGPASAVERAQRGGRRQLGAINDMLQQGGQQNGPDRMRGRGRMSSGMGPGTPISAPSTPVIPPPPPGIPQPGAEVARDTVRAIVNPDRADLITGNLAPTEERDRERRGRREHSGRHSRRSSRSPGRERDPKRGAQEEDRAREYRDRREPERDRHAPRSSPVRDLVAGRDTGSVRESGRDRERSDREGSRRDGRERDAPRDPHEAGWTAERSAERGADRGSELGGSGRSRDMRGEGRGDERRDSRGTRDDRGGRKRHSEGEPDPQGREKRVRR